MTGIFVIIYIAGFGRLIKKICFSIEEAKEFIEKDFIYDSGTYKILQIDIEDMKPRWHVLITYKNNSNEIIFETYELGSSSNTGPIVIEIDPIKLFALEILNNNPIAIDAVKDILKS